MSARTERRLVTPIPGVEQPVRHIEHGLHRGVRLNVRGRSIELRRFGVPRTGALAMLVVLGPGLVAAMAGDDAGGIATFSSVGAKFGYDLLWALVLITVSLSIVQETCARLGVATGRGLLDLVRERFGIGWALFAVSVVLVSNTGVVITEFVGIGAAAELFGISRYVAVPVCALLVWYFVIHGSYPTVERLFVVMTLVFLAYPAAAILGGPDWGAVARGTFVPTIRPDPEYLSLLVALIGTTMTPYMQLFQQSSVVEKGIARAHYGPERADAYAGAICGGLISACILIAAAATLHQAGMTDVETAEDAARALEPAAGTASKTLFAIGLLGASILAAGVLPLATAYAVSEVFGFRKGVNLDFRRAPFFMGVFSIVVAIGALVALVPGLPLISLLVGMQMLNGLLLPVVLLFILLLVNDRRLMRELANDRKHNVIGWGSLVLITCAAAALAANSVLGLFGLAFLG